MKRIEKLLLNERKQLMVVVEEEGEKSLLETL
jgi:hypothetical protein